MIIDDLRQRFAADCLAAGGAAGKAPALFDDLAARHAEPHRRYHGIHHLGALVRLMDQHAPHVGEGAPARLAIWWHDAIYDPRARDNEEQSAALCRAHLDDAGAPPELIDDVASLILVTRNHWDGPSTGDGDYFLDADIAILGAPADVYDRYAADVRSEYAWVPDDAFRTGRGAFLSSALARPRLFRTDVFETTYAGPARANLQRELDRLSA